MRAAPKPIRLLAACLLLPSLGTTAPAAEAPPPNIVVVLADDLGIECLPSYGGPHHTPHLDRLARDGMRFTHCFSHPYCSPSRASLLTGRYPFRHGVREVIWDLGRHGELFLPVTEPSFARQLKRAGYTTAIAGKWQLSFLHARNTIREFGFDRYQCWQIFDAGGGKTRRFHQPHFLRDGKVIAAEIADRYGPEVNVEFLVDFMRTSVERQQPFLAYHTCLLPHFPWVPTPASTDRDYEPPNATHKGNPKYFPDMVTALDRSVGQLREALEELGVADNTVFLFLADNGTDQKLETRWVDGHPVAGGKGSMTDRGTRVPLLAAWPGRIPAGTTCDDLVDFSDLLPTLCDLAGAPLPDGTIDGRSFQPQLLGKPGQPREWVLVQDKTTRHLRNRTHILTDRGQLRPVTDLWKCPAPPIKGTGTAADQTARQELRAAFAELGE